VTENRFPKSKKELELNSRDGHNFIFLSKILFLKPVITKVAQKQIYLYKKKENITYRNDLISWKRG